MGRAAVKPELLVGADSAVITPEPGRTMGGYASRASGASGTLDELMCRVVVLQKGRATLVIVSLDLLYVTERLAALVASRVTDDLHVEHKDVMVCATHTHCGPAVGAASENDDLYEAIAAAAELCAQRARTMSQPGVVLHRRFSIRGLVKNRREAGTAVDETGSVLFAVSSTGDVIASLITAACHPTVLEADTTQYSRDFPGVVCDTVEQSCGGRAMFLQGFAGDVNPIFHDHTPSDMQLLGKQIGARASTALLDGLRDLLPAFTVNLSADAVLPVASTAPAEALHIDELRSALLHVDVEPREEQGRLASRRALDAAYAAERNADSDEGRRCAVALRQACWIDDLMASRTSVLGVDYPPAVAASLPVQIFWLGPKLRVVGFPGEPLTRSACRLRTAMDDEVLLVGYANGAPSYLPPAEAFDHHGYEVGSTRHVRGTVEKLEDAAMRLASSPPSR